ncbi:unknown [[Mannheimia] succiniciproducens MBEL55E]|uniref:Uncharacterized protein n=1 Tax=Mannheimia succiniciproducens (strain KCTC 0769BP / MBEL55E) TaxID=221988 RepID=Q65RA3_MANSM|nr:unknown [[Mannheimia] succiniciproducens MBEL55E]
MKYLQNAGTRKKCGKKSGNFYRTFEQLSLIA